MKLGKPCRRGDLLLEPGAVEIRCVSPNAQKQKRGVARFNLARCRVIGFLPTIIAIAPGQSNHRHRGIEAERLRVPVRTSGFDNATTELMAGRPVGRVVGL